MSVQTADPDRTAKWKHCLGALAQLSVLVFVAVSVAFTVLPKDVSAEGCRSKKCEEDCQHQKYQCEQTNGALCAVHYSACLLDCGQPSPVVHDFGTSPLGESPPLWRERFVNPEPRNFFDQDGNWGGKRTLYASWQYPDCKNPGIISDPVAGPFKLAYGQRFELKPRERQWVAVEFRPQESEPAQATLYLYWDDNTAFEWEKVITFTGTGAGMPVSLIFNVINSLLLAE
jgi:hypothetical protein